MRETAANAPAPAPRLRNRLRGTLICFLREAFGTSSRDAFLIKLPQLYIHGKASKRSMPLRRSRPFETTRDSLLSACRRRYDIERGSFGARAAGGENGIHSQVQRA